MTEYKVNLPQPMIDDYKNMLREYENNAELGKKMAEFRHGALIDYIDSQIPRKTNFRTYQGNVLKGEITVNDGEATFTTSPPQLIK